MKKAINTNLEIYNFLNVVNRKLGKLYKYTGYSCLPSDFDVNEEKFKEVLLISQLKDETIQPSFAEESKKHFKKRLKLSLKRCTYILNHDLCKKYCDEHTAYFLEIYFDMREELISQILKETRDHDFDEISAWREIYNLNSILGAMTESLYDEKFDFESLFSNIEKNYMRTYLEKISALEKKQNKTRKKQNEIENNRKNIKNHQKNAKIEEKSAKNTKKTVKKQEIQKVRADIKKTKKAKTNKNSSKEK